MEIRGASMEDGLAGMATGMKSDQVQLQISTAMMVKIQDQNEAAAQALIRMMEQSTFGVGGAVDIRT
jgi:hypothetical protein